MIDLKSFITGDYRTPFYARKSFHLGSAIEKATLEICGLGQFICYINGKKVGDHEIDPGWTDYRKYAQYVEFDVASYLHEGENVLAAEIGNGWFLKEDTHYTFGFPKFMPPNPNPYREFCDSLVLAAKLLITCADGEIIVITTDEDFRLAKSDTVISNIYGSETYDARLRQPGWNKEDFDDSNWKPAHFVNKENLDVGSLTKQSQPAVKVIKTYPAKEIGKVNNRIIYDLGQNISGILDFSIIGDEGELINFYPAEKLNADGDVDQVAKGWTTVDTCVTAILDSSDSEQEFRMKFTYLAGRYIAVEANWEKVKLVSMKVDAITSAWQTNGSFMCDDKRFLQIYDLVEKAVEANMVSVHTDCPTIERFAWQEPNHLMAPSIMFMKDGKKLWEKFLTDMRMGQHGKDDIFYDFDGNSFPAGDGLIPSQCPCYIPNVIPVPGMGSFYDIIGWGSALILGAQWHYRFYGDIQIIKDNYDAGLRYFEYLKTKINEEGFINHGLGDWGNPSGEYARENIETALLYADVMALAQFSYLLEKEDTAAELERFAEHLKDNYNSKLLVQNEKTGLWCYRVYEHPDSFVMTQAAEAIPLYFGMVPENRISDVQESFRKLLMEENAFVCGEIGMPYVIQASHRCGWDQLIADFILRKEHPSYYAFVLDGETTLGEYWESNPRSHCHDMMGHIIEWYYRGIAGIEDLEPGFAKVRLRPWMPESISNFSCVFETVSGNIEIEIIEGTLEIEVRLKAQMPYELVIDRLEERSRLLLGDYKMKFQNQRNPILPLKFHVPDGEAHVMPDGKLYIYGSFDAREDVYCSEEYHIVSTTDLKNWEIEEEPYLCGRDIPWFNNPDAPKYPGIDWSHPTPFVLKMLAENPQDKEAFEKQEETKPALLFAPDCIHKDGKYYLYICMPDDSEGVLVADHPAGPFENPVQLPCGGIDPGVFIDNDGTGYLYWGQLFSHGVKLNKDMISFDPDDIVDDLVTEEQHCFHEGSSMRKIGDTYYYLYADMERQKPTSLGYSTSKSPLGPFTYQGIIIDNQFCDPNSWNNHGSIEQIDGQWYVFYHRCSRNSQLHRRLCIEKINVLPDGTIPEVKMTSQGVGQPFSPGEVIMGYQACEVHGGCYIDVDEDFGEKLTNLGESNRAIFRYVKSDEGWKNIHITGKGNGTITILFDEQEAGVVDINSEEWKEYTAPIQASAGQFELCLEVVSGEGLEIAKIMPE